MLAELEEDVEGLIVNRTAEPHQYAIAPIDECYRLVGTVKASWEGISGGGAVERVVPAFLEELRACGRGAAVDGGERPTPEPVAAGPTELRGARRPGAEAGGGADPRLRRRASRTPPGARCSRSRSRSQIAIEPAERRYDAETRERLTELLGDPARIGAPIRIVPWAQVDVLVQPFRGSTTVEVPVPCSYDLEVAAANYFRSLADGEVPLRFHFNGSVYYGDADGRLQIVQLSWEESSGYRMPVAAWQRDDRRLLPGPRLGPGRGGDDRAAAPLQARPGAALLRGGAGEAARPGRCR